MFELHDDATGQKINSIGFFNSKKLQLLKSLRERFMDKFTDELKKEATQDSPKAAPKKEAPKKEAPKKEAPKSEAPEDPPAGEAAEENDPF